MKIFTAVLAVFLIFSATQSHAWISFSPKDNDEELVRIFEEIEAEGKRETAIVELEEYIRRNYYRASTDEAVLRLARAYSAKKDYHKAGAAYERLLESYPGSRFKFNALYELGQIRFTEGRLKEARDLVKEVSTSSFSSIALRVKAKSLLKEIDSSLYAVSYDTDAPAIGVLVPLSGAYSQFGEAALNGVLLAAEVFGEGYGYVTVYVKDVGADPDAALQAVAELVENKRVVGLVGPLLSATASEIAEYAQKKRIPLVTLSQKKGVTNAGDYVFRNFLTPAQQASSIAEYAAGELGLRKFAVMYPENNYGKELAGLFELEVLARGGEILSKVSYASGTRDFSTQITDIFGIEVQERTEGRRVIREYTPTENVEAVYIPDYYTTVSLVAPYLTYYNIDGVRLLGSNGWNSNDLLRKAGRYVEGAVFVDGFFAGSSRLQTMEFTERFTRVYGRQPGVLEAQAYDAARIMITALKQGSGERADRRTLKKELEKLDNFPGAAGDLSFDARGEAVKKLFVLTVQNGQIVEAPPDGLDDAIARYRIFGPELPAEPEADPFRQGEAIQSEEMR